MSSTAQQQAIAEDDPPWEQELGTGRWFIPRRDDLASKPSARNQKKKKFGTTVASSSRFQGPFYEEPYANHNRGQGVEVYDDREHYKQPEDEFAHYDTHFVSVEEAQSDLHTEDDRLASTVEALSMSTADVGVQGQYSTLSSSTSQWPQQINATPSTISYHTLPIDAGEFGYGGSAQSSWQGHGYGNSATAEASQVQTFAKHRYVAGQGMPTDGDYEEFDSSYRQRNKDYKKFFRTGRVFGILWTEPCSDMTANDNETFESQVTLVRFGQMEYRKIRRFVVVVYNPEDSFCKCLPVTTYDGKGVEKRGINLKEHGQIYSSNKRPSHARGITKSPLKVNLSREARHLAPALVNYGKAYTVETNVKVKDIGELDAASRKLLRQYWNASMIVEVDSDCEDKIGGNELLGIGAGLGPAEYTTTYDANYSASTSSAYNEQPYTNSTLDSAVVANRQPSISRQNMVGYAMQNQAAGEHYESHHDGSMYPAARSKSDQLSSTKGETNHTISSTTAQYGPSHTQRLYGQPAEHHSPYQHSTSSASTQYDVPAASTSATPSSREVHFILDHRTSQDRMGKRVAWYLVSWVGDYDDSWVTNEDISQDWIDYYHNSRSEGREGKAMQVDTELSPTSENEVGEDEEDLLSSIHQAHAERSLRESSAVDRSRLESNNRAYRDRTKFKKRTWF